MRSKVCAAAAALAVFLSAATVQAQWGGMRWTGGFTPGNLSFGGRGGRVTIQPFNGRIGFSAPGGIAASTGAGGWRVRQLGPYGGFSVGSGTSRTLYGRVPIPGVGRYTAGGNILPQGRYANPARVAGGRYVHATGGSPRYAGGSAEIETVEQSYGGAAGSFDDFAAGAAAAQDRARAVLDRH